MATQLSTAELDTGPDDYSIELSSVPAIDQNDAVEAYRAFDDGALAEAPFALAAYVFHQQQFAI